MIQRPNAVGLILCQLAIIEEGTKHVTLVNTFRRLKQTVFPTPALKFIVHAVLADGLGPITLSLAINRLDVLEEMEVRVGEINFNDPLVEQRLLIRLSAVHFPEPGRYEISLLANGEEVAQCVFRLLSGEE